LLTEFLVANVICFEETSRTLNTRIKEHKYAIITSNINNAIAKHALDTGHITEWNILEEMTMSQKQ